MKDVQSYSPEIELFINWVGVKNLPFIINISNNILKKVKANIDFFVSLDSHWRGTHMSRFYQTLLEFKEKDFTNIEIIKELLSKTKENFDTENTKIHVKFDWPFNMQTPKSNIETTEFANITINSMFLENNFKNWIDINLNTMTLCPCSKEISQNNAHNQRASIKVSVWNIQKFHIINEIINIIINSSSAPLFCILKRIDEKYITEKSYENPNFVEDLARKIIFEIKNNLKIEKATIEIESFESIHPYNAYCKIY